MEKYLQQGYEILFLTCDGEVPSCDLNPHHSFGKCYRCKSRRDLGLKWIGEDRIKTKSFYLLTDTQRNDINSILKTNFDSIDSIKNLIVEESDIGLAALSSMVSILREPEPNLNIYQDLIKAQIETALIVHFSIKNHILNYKPDEIVLYNGRLAILRPVLRLAQTMGIQVYVHERAGTLDRYSLTSNHSPHDLLLMKDLISSFYFESSLSEQEKKEIARTWFDERCNNQDSGGFHFTKLQEIGLLPKSINTNKLKISIFNSSEDEMVAIGGWENPCYLNQNDALEKIFSSLSDHVQLILRIHPNLNKIKNSQTQFVEVLKNRFPQVDIVPASSKVSTYSLIQASDIVITFGSTVGIESCYQQKLTILLGRSMYEDAKSLIKPDNHNKFVQIIMEIVKTRKFPLIEFKDEDWAMYGFFCKYYGNSFKFLEHRDLYQVDLVRNGKRSRIQASIASRMLARTPF